MGFCQQSFKSSRVADIVIKLHPLETPKIRHDDDDADGRLNLHWLWIFGENKVDGWMGGEGCIGKKSKGGL